MAMALTLLVCRWSIAHCVSFLFLFEHFCKIHTYNKIYFISSSDETQGLMHVGQRTLLLSYISSPECFPF